MNMIELKYVPVDKPNKISSNRFFSVGPQHEIYWMTDEPIPDVPQIVIHLHTKMIYHWNMENMDHEYQIRVMNGIKIEHTQKGTEKKKQRRKL